MRNLPDWNAPKERNFRKELEKLINRFSKENGSNTPDWILAEYLAAQLDVFDTAVMARSEWNRGSVLFNDAQRLDVPDPFSSLVATEQYLKKAHEYLTERNTNPKPKRKKTK